MGDITLTLKVADELSPALTELANLPISPLKVSYRIGKMHRKLTTEVADFHKVRLDLMKTLGEEKENGHWVVFPENLEKWTEEIDSLMDEKIVLTRVAKIHIDEIDDFEGLKIKPISMAMLEPLIDGLD
jgi:hypothetical protein